MDRLLMSMSSLMDNILILLFSDPTPYFSVFFSIARTALYVIVIVTPNIKGVDRITKIEAIQGIINDLGGLLALLHGRV